MADYLVFHEYLLFLGLMIPAIFFAAVIMMRSKVAMKVWFQPDDYKLFAPEFRFMLRVVGFFLLIVALLSPYWGRREQTISKLSREIYILLDISGSMNCADIGPSRLAKVKKELKSFVNQFKGDQIGLIVFTNDAYVQCPLTDDTRVVTMLLDVVGTDQFASNGTDFRAALSMALERFTQTEKATRKTARAIVLISDGEDFGETYTSVTDRLKSEDIELFTVGVGTEGGAKVPIFSNGEVVGYKTNEDGSEALSKISDESLISLAEQFGTQYVKMDDGEDDLGPVMDQLRLMSASEVDKKIQLSQVNRYQWFLGFSFLSLALSQVLSPIRRKKSPHS